MKQRETRHLYDREFSGSKKREGLLEEHDLFGSAEGKGVYDIEERRRVLEHREAVLRGEEAGAQYGGGGPRFAGGGRGSHREPRFGHAKDSAWLIAAVDSFFGYDSTQHYGKSGDRYETARWCAERYKKTGDLTYLGLAYLHLAAAEAEEGKNEEAQRHMEEGVRLIGEDIYGKCDYDCADLVYNALFRNTFQEDEPDLWAYNTKNSIHDKDPVFVDPEEVLGRIHHGMRPRPHPVKLREEATDIERVPHAVDIYHYEHEARKKADEIPVGQQVNPGPNPDLNEKGGSNQGAETVWRMKTWATDPDFPSSAQTEKMMENQMEQKEMNQEFKN